MTPSPEDLRAFRDFEQAGWNSTAAKYDQHFAGLSPGFCEPLLDAAEVQEGVRVLDIATGPGYVAGAAANRGADVVGIDFAPNMVAEARSLHPGATFQEGDAEDLPFPDDTFDAVVINFGMLHFSRPDAVLTEVRRVLRPGGRLAFTVWGNPQQAALGFGILMRAVETFGTLDVGLPVGPPMFRFSDHSEASKSLLEAGFTDPQISDLPFSWELPNADSLFQAFSEAGVRAGALFRAQEPQALEAINEFVRNELQPYQQGDTVGVPMGAVLASAVNPG